MADKDYAATREEWERRLVESWRSYQGAEMAGVIQYMIAQGWLPVKEPEPEEGCWHKITDADGYVCVVWRQNRMWWVGIKASGEPDESAIFREPITVTRLRPDSEVKG